MKEEKFVVAIYVPSSLHKTLGGAFTYIEVLTDFLLKVDDDDICFKIVTEGNIEEHNLDEIVIDYSKIKYSFKQLLVLKISSILTFLKKNKRIKNFKII